MKRHERPIDIRDARLRGGRIKLSARATSLPEWRRREAAIRTLLDQGEYLILERVRAGVIHIADAQRAVEAGDLMPLRAHGLVFRIGARADAMIDRASPGVLHNYRALLGALRRYFGDDRDMATVTREDALRFLHAPHVTHGKETPQPWSVGRRRNARVICGKLWREAIHAAAEAAEIAGDRPTLTRNPWKEAKPARGTKEEEITPRVAYLRPEQWRRLLDKVRGTRRAALYALGCLAGLRLEEVLNLRTHVDLDFQGNRVRIQPREGEYEWSPKGWRGVRDIPMSPELRAILEEHVRIGYAGERYLILSTAEDRPIPHTSRIQRWARDDFTAAGLTYGRDSEGLTFHSLRHTFASWAVQEGESLLKVAKLMGDRAEMVEEVYGHLGPTDLETVTTAVGKKSAAHPPIYPPLTANVG